MKKFNLALVAALMALGTAAQAQRATPPTTQRPTIKSPPAPVVVRPALRSPTPAPDSQMAKPAASPRPAPPVSRPQQ